MLHKKQYRVYFLIFFAVPFSYGASTPKPGYLFFPSRSEVEECKKNLDKCLDFANYPHEHIEKLFDEGRMKKEWFSSKLEQDVYSVGNSENNRSTALCDFKVNVSYPKGGITENEAFIYIVQNEFYRQPVVRTTCWNSKNVTSCEVDGANLSSKLEDNLGLNFYEYNCVERKGIDYSELLVGINENGQIIRVSIKKECACVCEYKRIK